MEIYLDKRAVRQIRLSAQDAVEEGDIETLREDILEAFTEEQVEEIERRLDNGDFFEFLTDLLDEWSGDDPDELFELLDTQLGDVGVDLKFEKRPAGAAAEPRGRPRKRTRGPTTRTTTSRRTRKTTTTKTKTRKKRKKAGTDRLGCSSLLRFRLPARAFDVGAAGLRRSRFARPLHAGALRGGARHVAAVGEVVHERRQA